MGLDGVVAEEERGGQAISPVRSTKRPEPAPGFSVARPTIA
jgi:hypothetical protein